MKTLIISLLCFVSARLFFGKNNFNFLDSFASKINQDDIDDAILRSSYLAK
jgi:hypothetical protein